MPKRTREQVVGNVPIAMPGNIKGLIEEFKTWINSQDIDRIANFLKSDVIYSSKVRKVSSGIIKREIVTRPLIEALYVDDTEAFNNFLKQINTSRNPPAILALTKAWDSILEDPNSDLSPGLFDLCSDTSMQMIRDKLGDMKKYADKLKRAGIDKGNLLGYVHHDVCVDLDRLAAMNQSPTETNNPIETALLKQDLIKSLTGENAKLAIPRHSSWTHAVVHICAVLLGGGLPYLYHRIKTGHWSLFDRTDSMIQVESVQKAFDSSGKGYAEVMELRRRKNS